MDWGLAGPWLGGYGIGKCKDPLMGKLRFLVEHGFKSTGVRLGDLDTPQRIEEVGAFLAEHDLHLSGHLGGFRPLEEDFDKVEAGTEAFCEELAAKRGPLRIRIVTCSVGPYHRFMADPPLEKQMALLERNLSAVARRCRELGCPLGIENHGDYYCSDLVALCRRVPGLGILLDTGNCFLVGEKPVPACREAAPYTIGTHFKDHIVRPELRDGLKFVIGGAALGHGHVGLREIHRDLIALAPDPHRLVMQWELIPQKDPLIEDDMELLELSWRFIRTLPEPEARA